MLRDPTFLGTVEAVSGSTVTAALHTDTASGIAFVKGYGYRVGQVGSFVRIPMGYSDLFGIVTTIGAAAVPERLTATEPFGHRSLTIQIVGEGTRKGNFQRGISQFPTIGDAVHLVTETDLVRIYGRPTDGKYVSVGRIASAESISALIDINKLLTRHSAVLGSTGSGKSTTVAALLTSLSNKSRYPSARVLLMDVHGEYARAFQGRASVFRINANRDKAEQTLCVPYWALTFDELLDLTLGEMDDAEHGMIRVKVEEMKRAALKFFPSKGVDDSNLTVDLPIPFSLRQLWFNLHKWVYATYTEQGTAQTEATMAYELDAKGIPVEKGDPQKVIPPRYRSHTLAAGATKIYQAHNTPNIRRQVDALATKLRDKRFGFLFDPGPWSPDLDGKPSQDLDKLVQAWIGGKQPVTVLDLSGIPSTVLATLIGSLLRILYDCLFWARYRPEGGRERPLLVVLEEAHAYLSSDSGGRASIAVKRIVKEGRKYGIGAMVVSQRPSEIDPTILSQCGTLFAMRLSNATDRAHVVGSVTDNLEGLLAGLPSLRTGEVIIVGEAVHLPMRAIIDPPPLNRRPESDDPKVYTSDDQPGGWNSRLTPENYEEVVTLWRKQGHRTDENKEPKKKSK